MKYWEGIGRRKETVARVRIYKKGADDKNLVNGQAISKFFSKQEMSDILSPLKVVDQLDNFYFTVVVKGGGKTGWREAIRLGLARALVEFDNEFKSPLRKASLLTRDPRVVERKKVGLKKARKAPRFSKR